MCSVVWWRLSAGVCVCVCVWICKYLEGFEWKYENVKNTRIVILSPIFRKLSSSSCYFDLLRIMFSWCTMHNLFACWVLYGKCKESIKYWRGPPPVLQMKISLLIIGSATQPVKIAVYLWLWRSLAKSETVTRVTSPGLSRLRDYEFMKSL